MVSGYAQKFKMAEPSDNRCSSEDDEYSDPSETMVLHHIHSCVSEKLYIFHKHITKVCFVRIQSRGYRHRNLPIQPRIRFL